MAVAASSMSTSISIHSVEHDLEKLERLEPWIDDGNIVLAAEGKCFRVHRSTLRSYSAVFKDMFSIPHSDDIEKEVIDGCPVIRLQDAAADVQIMLTAFYDRSYVFFQDKPMPVATLVAFLRLGKKYAIRQLFEEAKGRLTFDTPPLTLASTMASGNTVLFSRLSGNDPFNFRVITVANEVGLLLPAIVATVYACVACPATSIVDGYDFDGSRCTLSASSQRLCLLMQRYISEAERTLLMTISPAPPTNNCHNNYQSIRSSGYSQCQAVGHPAIICAIVCCQSPFTAWAWDGVGNICNNCRAELKRRFEETRTRLWNDLPVGIGLGPWEDLNEDAEIES